jgi:hypothetical protein
MFSPIRETQHGDVIVFFMDAQVNRYGYLYFHRKFASYGAVNGQYRSTWVTILFSHILFFLR